MIFQPREEAFIFMMLGLMFVIGFLGCVIQIVMAVWTHKDAKKRNMSADLWAIVVLLLGLLGLIIYLIVRDPIAQKEVEPPKAIEPVPQEKTPEPQQTKRFCTECGAEIEAGAQFCPHCGNKMRGI
ncbi:MAG: zinc-ribbon domain-containing protein [Candidatus Hermodarchaeota archaeon]